MINHFNPSVKFSDRRNAMNQSEKLLADLKVIRNELCQRCGKYRMAHEGACDGCRWKEPTWNEK